MKSRRVGKAPALHLRKRLRADLRRLVAKIHAEPLADNRILWLGRWTYVDELLRWIERRRVQ